MSSTIDTAPAAPQPISRAGCYIVLVFAFLGWAFAGVHMSINGIVMRVATADLMQSQFVEQGISDAATGDTAVSPALLGEFDNNKDGTLDGTERGRAREASLGQWFGWLTCAFLLGAAFGGYLFGVAGDRFGRAKAMAASILCYSIFSSATYFVQDPTQLLVLRFLTCMGIGGMWPNGIALLSEAWPNVSRPILAGAMGTAANVGILIFALSTIKFAVSAEDWRWTFLVGASPIVLGILSLLLVPESPHWLALRQQHAADGDSKIDRPQQAGLMEIFRPPILKLTIIGILLGTVPLFGGWGVGNWATAWASEVGDTKKVTATENTDSDAETAKQETQEKKPDPVLKSMAVVARSLPGSISSLLGGALAFWLGRKRSYFLLSLGALVCTQFLFRSDPADQSALFVISLFGRSLKFTEFLAWTAGLGFFSGFFFGWLPYCLPELFPTRVRSTGAGVSFNWGRILTAIGVLATAALLKQILQGRYDIAGQYTGLIYVLGMIVVWFIPSSSEQSLNE
ncbi:MAG: MFS transporter [Planctomycetaceae bacterium]|jgi:MFS transporter, SHS family, sialic acid transporter|nr:MFS transporter [Planctomycetaceae bacterium]MBT6156415.1 MFS transporter [Planctomycetaceae bacterium]MBT6487971.1 MFS transporter [Planctomycetaceae bacterium]MBT6495032.1 MFS transporter [Planctomycetaceae bacterium]